MELKDKQIIYSLNEVVNGNTVIGNVEVDDDNNLLSTNFYIEDVDNNVVANVYYSVDNGKVTRNVNGVSESSAEAIENEVNAIIQSIKDALNA